MSSAAETRPELPGFGRLERSAEDAAHALEFWHRRATEAEAEMVRLRQALEEVAASGEPQGKPGEEIRRLRAENTALRSRMQQARRRVNALIVRLGALEAAR